MLDRECSSSTPHDGGLPATINEIRKLDAPSGNQDQASEHILEILVAKAVRRQWALFAPTGVIFHLLYVPRDTRSTSSLFGMVDAVISGIRRARAQPDSVDIRTSRRTL